MFYSSFAGIKLDVTAHSHFLLWNLEVQKATNRSLSKSNQVINIYLQSKKEKEQKKDFRASQAKMNQHTTTNTIWNSDMQTKTTENKKECVLN